MKIPAKLFIRFLLLIGLVIVLFSFAMFQGGFLSWFLFYSYIPFFLYYMLFIFYPLHKWKVDSNLSSRVVHAGDQVNIELYVQRTFPFPIPFSIFQLEIPESLHKKDTRRKDKSLFSEQGIVRYFRQAITILFPWFKREFKLSFTFSDVPRGEHQFTQFIIQSGDLFGFIEKEQTFSLNLALIVYPFERQIKVMRSLSTFDGGAVPYYTHQLKNTSVAGGVREYEPGDKFSWIDWKQTARQQEIMTKEFDQEQSTEMLIIFNGTAGHYSHPIAFEGAIELTLAMFEELVFRDDKVHLLSIGDKLTQFTKEDIAYSNEILRRHFAQIQPNYTDSLIVQINEARRYFESYNTYIFITTIIDQSFVQSIDFMKKDINEIHVLYIQASPYIHEEEQKNMQFLRANGLQIHILTDKQLSFDPIEVKF